MQLSCNMSRTPTIQPSILKVLEKKHLLSARSIQTELEKNLSVNKTSVYRALEHLLSQGIICAYTLFGNETMYELRDAHHDHVVCMSCHIVEKVECSHPSVDVQKNWKIDHHHAVFYGKCHSCTPTERNSTH
jgi:Fe2+ or Zn2+ uptake regulation protein